jgi:hypothetical protein
MRITDRLIREINDQSCASTAQGHLFGRGLRLRGTTQNSI